MALCPNCLMCCTWTGALHLLVDLIPSNIIDTLPPYIANVLRFLVAVTKDHNLEVEALDISMVSGKLENILGQTLGKSNKLIAVENMLNSWLAAEVIAQAYDNCQGLPKVSIKE